MIFCCDPNTFSKSREFLIPSGRMLFGYGTTGTCTSEMGPISNFLGGWKHSLLSGILAPMQIRMILPTDFRQSNVGELQRALARSFEEECVGLLTFVVRQSEQYWIKSSPKHGCFGSTMLGKGTKCEKNPLFIGQTKCPVTTELHISLVLKHVQRSCEQLRIAKHNDCVLGIIK